MHTAITKLRGAPRHGTPEGERRTGAACCCCQTLKLLIRSNSDGRVGTNAGSWPAQPAQNIALPRLRAPQTAQLTGIPTAPFPDFFVISLTLIRCTSALCM